MGTDWGGGCCGSLGGKEGWGWGREAGGVARGLEWVAALGLDRWGGHLGLTRAAGLEMWSLGGDG